MNKIYRVLSRVLICIICAAAVILAALYIYTRITEKKAVKAAEAAENSDVVAEYLNSGRDFLLKAQKAPVTVYFMENDLGVESRFYDGRLYVPYEETCQKLESLMERETAEGFGVKFNNFIFSGYGEDEINPFFKEIDGRCFISFYKLIKGMGLCCCFNGDEDKVTIYYRKTDTSDTPSVVKNDNALPALLRLEDITPDGYCENPRYTDEGLEKLRCMAEYLEQRGQTFYVAWIMRYVNPEEGIDIDFTKMTNTYTADFMYTLDFLRDKGGSIVLHGYTHQYGDDYSAKGFEFGYGSPFSVEERAERLWLAKGTADLLGYESRSWEFAHYGATNYDLAMAEEVYDVIFQSASKLFNGEQVVVKKAADGHNVTYVPLPAYYLNNIYELDDMLDRIDKCESKGYVLGLFFHPSIDFEYIFAESTPWGVRNWHYAPYGALPVITDKVLTDGYTFTDFEKYAEK